jgi:hypothetical protein
MSSPTSKRRDPSPAAEPAKKRRRGATRLSCAECRRSLQSPLSFLCPFLNTLVFRLKLRCDRGIPCGSCVKRGCGAICPDGNYMMLGLSLETASAHGHLQGLLPLDRAIGTSLRMFASCLVPTLHIGLYLHPPKSYTRRSQNCVLVSAISRMHSEQHTRKIQMSLTQCYPMSYCVLKLLYNAKLPQEIRRQ